MKSRICALASLPALLFLLDAAHADQPRVPKRAAAATAEAAAPVQMHPLPQAVANNSTVVLHCGRHYQGTLNLAERTNVTVRTEGNCGKASITPAQQVRGWSRQRGSVWIAPVDFQPVQVSWNDKPLTLAHHPNKPWAKGRSTGPERVQAQLPSEDIAGARIVYRPAEWMIETRSITGYENGAILLGPKVGDQLDPTPETPYYVEGKLWMLDQPGEWVWHDGWLFVWSPDGQSPEGRLWAAPAAAGIDARHSRNITVENVRIHDAQTGISAPDSVNLLVRNVEISNSAHNGIFAGGRGLTVDSSRIVNAGQNGVLGYYGITEVAVSNSVIENTGMRSAPKRSKGGISLEESSNARISNNRILNSSYIGIRVHRDAVVSNNLVDGACLILSDCGGIYTFARDRQALNVRIENNTVRNLAGRYAYGVYLDDSANNVTVSRNLLVNNPGGIEIHNGFNNLITENIIADSGHEHILFNETGGDSVLRNRILRNLFVSSKKEATFRLWSEKGTRNLVHFGQFDDNIYVGPDSGRFAELQGTGMVSWVNWRMKMGQDSRSRLDSSMESGRERQKKWAAGSTLGRAAP